MKYLYRISLIFMILTILSACLLGGYYLYQSHSRIHPQNEQEPYLAKETSTVKDTTDCDTEYVILMQDLVAGGSETIVETIPAKYINKTKEQLELLLQEEERAPALQDREKGLESIRLSVFSNERVVVVKTYRRDSKPKQLEEEVSQAVMGTDMKPVEERSVSANQMEGYYLMAKAGYVAVYNSDMKTMYLATGIALNQLPEELQQEILDKKYIKNEEELYNFLESYSS